MSENKHLDMDLSGFWTNEGNKLIIRFRDISPEMQTTLATRIKNTSSIRRTRIPQGPTIETIQEILDEINPVIFSEATADWYCRNSDYRLFARYATRSLSGYTYKNLCQIIYHLTYGRKKLNANLLRKTIILTSTQYNHEIITSFINRHFNTPIAPPQDTPITTEISMPEITAIRERLPNQSNDLVQNNAPWISQLEHSTRSNNPQPQYDFYEDEDSEEIDSTTDEEIPGQY
jgi:hypothetical protein